MKCPSCGANATGKFCSACGARLGAATCGACGAAQSAGAKFCHVCGAPAGAGQASAGSAPRPSAVPWIVAGALVVALLIVLAVTLLRPGVGPSGPTPTAQAPAGPVDLTQITPRQAADRLFERVVSADERGATDTAAFFAPMALRAYDMVGPLDEDARYHVGLIQLVLDNLDATLAQADSIAASVPTHLFAPLLRARVAADRGDSVAERRANRAFLDHYDTELAANRPEYQLHAALLEQYRQALTQRGGPR